MSDHSGAPSPERKTEIAARDTFPASDPQAQATTKGVRAVPPESLMADDAVAAGIPADAATLRQDFPDAESAKLALERLVREAPLDRRCAELSGAELVLRVPRADAPRVEALLRQSAVPAAGL
ncbi:MAG: hypothetical protein K2X74_02890 [Acetobacteraceae bacterium]|nr:hypothetical protein [Acetobacteraceae bacterium]